MEMGNNQRSSSPSKILLSFWGRDRLVPPRIWVCNKNISLISAKDL